MTKVGLKAGVLLSLIVGACGEPPSAALPPPLLVKKTAPDEAGNAALATGKLVLSDGCLMLETADRSRTLLLWPAEARIERAVDGTVRVLGTEGKAQKTVLAGEDISVGGGELGGTSADTALVGPGRPIEATSAFPEQCVGPVWNVYSFEPAGEAGAAMLQGKWVVAKLNGAPRGPGDHLMRVTVEGNRFRVQSQCVPYWWTFTASGGAFSAKDDPYPGAVCERTRTNWELAFEEAMDRAMSLEQRDQDLLIRGPGGQVLLRRE